MTVAERVALGAALLDERRPGWWERTDLIRLEMSSTCHCMLGQEFAADFDRAGQPAFESPYSLGAEQLSGMKISGRPAVEWATEHGFEFTGDREDYVALRFEWLRVIEQRRAGVTP